MKKTRKFSIYPACLMLGLAACGTPVEDAEQGSHLMLGNSASGKAIPTLGTGYDSVQNKFLTTCASSDNPQIIGSTAGQLHANRRVDYQTAERNINASLDVRARYMMVNGSVSISAQDWMKEDRFSQTYIIMSDYEFGSRTMNPNDVKLTKLGENALAINDWDAVCGDSVVYQEKLGATLYVVVRMDFDNEETKKEFNADASVSANFVVGGASMSASWKEAMKTYKKRASISLAAFQFGGDPTTLGGIFTGTGAGQETKPGEGTKAFLSCGLDNLDGCAKFLEIATNHAARQGEGSFSASAKAQPAILDVVTAPWRQYPVSPLVSPSKLVLDDMLAQAQADLETKYQLYRDTKIRVQQLLSSDIAMPPTYLTNLKKLQEDLGKSSSAIASAADYCYNLVEFHESESAPNTKNPKLESVQACKGKVDAIVLPVIEQGTLEAGGLLHIEAASLERNLGQPTGPLMISSDKRGYYRSYASGLLSWNPEDGVIFIKKTIADFWLSIGGANSAVGWPINRGFGLKNGGYFHEFKNGHIYVVPGHQRPYIVQGEIFSRWGQTGYENGFLGYPIGNAYGYGSAVVQNFEGGTITQAGTVTSAIPKVIWDKYLTGGGSATYGYPTSPGEWLTKGDGYFVEFHNLRNYAFYRNAWGDALVIYGEIRNLYKSKGAQTSWLGYPIEDEIDAPAGGRMTRFENGVILWRAGIGAVATQYGIYSTWTTMVNALGYPTAEGWQIKDNGYFTHFEKGSIYRTPKGTYQMIDKPTFDAWAKVSWEAGYLGYPIAAARTHGTGSIQDFEGGSIVRGPYGTFSMPKAVVTRWLNGGGAVGVTLPGGIVLGKYGWPISQGWFIRDGGFFTHFEGEKSIYSSPKGTFSVAGKIRKEWEKKGWENSCVGYPIAEANVKSEREADQAFEHGRMVLVSFANDAYQECKR